MKNKNLNINKEHTKEVLQKEWGVSSPSDDRYVLATTNIVYCTGFYGHDLNHTVGFLCHFDLPWSTGSLPCVFNELLKHIPKETKLQCYLVGGWSFLWSTWTRVS